MSYPYQQMRNLGTMFMYIMRLSLQFVVMSVWGRKYPYVFARLTKRIISNSAVLAEGSPLYHEVTAYLSPLRLADEEKSSSLIFWKKSCGRLPEFGNVSPVCRPIWHLVRHQCRLRACFDYCMFIMNRGLGLVVRTRIRITIWTCIVRTHFCTRVPGSVCWMKVLILHILFNSCMFCGK